MKKDIAVVVLNYIQYVNIIPGIKKLIDLGYNVDFYCNDTDNNQGFKELFSDAREYMKQQELNVYTKPLKVKYKVLLEPYPSGMNINAKYKIRYRYGNVSAKPNIVYLPKNYIMYDCVLCSGKYDSNYLCALTNTYVTANQKFIDFKKDNNKKYNKKVLLYLPTYGKECSIDLIEDELKNLQKDYYVIAKIHHGTSYLKDEKERIAKVKDNVNEFYDLHKDIADLLKIADVVLTDNSGAIFEAIYTNVPVAIFTDDINKNKLDDFNTIQYELYKEGIIPYTNKKENIKKILKEAQSTKVFNKQKKWNKENLFHPKDLTKDFVDVIQKYLKDDINQRYYEMHNVLKNNYYGLCNQIDDLNNQLVTLNNDLNNKVDIINNLENEIIKLNSEKNNLQKEINNKDEKISSLEKELYYYKTGKLYKMANKVYQLKNGGKTCKKNK